MSNKKILITGSCGFVFSNFIKKVIYEKHPYQIVSLDKVNANALNSLYWNHNHDFHIADITDAHILNIIFQFEKPDIVIHGAAETDIDSSTSSNFVSSNVLGTQNIIDCCIKYNVEKLIYISTAEVYGQLLHENDPSWNENALPNPRNVYAATKAAGELLVKSAHESHGLTYNITRSCNNYGRHQNTKKLIPKVIKCILNNEKIPVYGQGLQMRDWMFVGDNGDAIIKILNDGAPNEIYNVSANQELTNIEVIQKICNIVGRGHDLITYVDDVSGHNFRYSVDTTKIRNLGWKPNYKFKNGIKDTVQWFVDNEWYFKQ